MSYPFIKLLKSPRNRYFYDVGKNGIIKISDGLYRKLEMVEAGTLKWETLCQGQDEELDNLLSEGYFSTDRVKHIMHPYTDFCSDFLERKIDKITLQITQECNFRCKYCVYSEVANSKQRTHSSMFMRWETAKQAIDFYFQHSIDSASRNIGFYGGEPLLRLDLIRRIVKYAEDNSKWKPLSFNITTNGSLLSEDIVQFLAEHHVQLLVSLDGNKNIQDKNRVFANGKGTFEKVIANLTEIKRNFPTYYQSIRFNSVLNPENDIDDVLSLTEFLPGIPIDSYQTNYVENTDKAIFPTFEYLKKTEYQRMLAFMAFSGGYPEGRLSLIGNKTLRDLRSSYQRFRESMFLPKTYAPGGPCLPGKSRLFVAADGNFYPCERVNESEHMRIGNLKEGFDYTAIKQLLNIGELTAERCKNCWAIRHCVICAKMCDDGEKISRDCKLNNCEKSKSIAETKLRHIVFCHELENNTF